MRNSFIFYKSFYEAIKKIPEEYQLELYNAIFSYSLEGIDPIGLSPVSEAIFILMKPNIDSSQRKYEASVKNGKKGGRPKKETQEKPNNNPEKNQKKPKQNLNDNEDEEDNDKGNDIEDDLLSKEEKLQQRFVECLNSFNTNAINECISYLDDLPYEVIKSVLVKTSGIQFPNWNYAKAILDDYVKRKIDSLEKIEAEKSKSNSSNKNESALEEWLNE